jgi:hypothetical protein
MTCFDYFLSTGFQKIDYYQFHFLQMIAKKISGEFRIFGGEETGYSIKKEKKDGGRGLRFLKRSRGIIKCFRRCANTLGRSAPRSYGSCGQSLYCIAGGIDLPDPPGVPVAGRADQDIL